MRNQKRIRLGSAIPGKIRSPALLLCLLLLCLLPYGAAYSWDIHETEVINQLDSREVSVEVTEHFPDHTLTAGGKRTKQVAFQNDGTAPVVLRVHYSETFESTTELLPGMSAVKNWTPEWTSQWEKKPDGWYYYRKVLAPGETTARVLDSIRFPSELGEANHYALIFFVESVQVSDEDAVNQDATLTAFGRRGSVTEMTVSQTGAVVSGSVQWE